MKFTCLDPADLTANQIEAWEELQQAQAAYHSPFFSPHFTLAVSASRTDAHVTVIEDNGRVGFFPFEVDRWKNGRAVGWGLNDFQDIILPPEFPFEVRQLLLASGLRTWQFDHLLLTDKSLACERHQSPVIDLHSGFDAYCHSRSSAGSEVIKKTVQAERKLVRERGEVRLELESTSAEVMSALIAWKTAQLRRKGRFLIFEIPWVRSALDLLRRSSARSCRGQLAALYANGQPIAAHFGLRSERVMHWWITAFNPEYERYSPGSILLLRLAEALAAEGIGRIDLGKGDENYKQRFMTGATPIGEGVVCASWLGIQWHHIVRHVRKLARAAGLRPAVHTMKRLWQATAPPKDVN